MLTRSGMCRKPIFDAARCPALQHLVHRCKDTRDGLGREIRRPQRQYAILAARRNALEILQVRGPDQPFCPQVPGPCAEVATIDSHAESFEVAAGRAW